VQSSPKYSGWEAILVQPSDDGSHFDKFSTRPNEKNRVIRVAIYELAQVRTPHRAILLAGDFKRAGLGLNSCI